MRAAVEAVRAAGAAAVVVGVPVASLTDQLTASIACRLDPEEQKQAAEATLEATRVAEETGDVEAVTFSQLGLFSGGVSTAGIIAEEAQGHRALYVALTRSTKRLSIVHAEPLPPYLV